MSDKLDTLREAMAHYHGEGHKLAVLLINERGNVVRHQMETHLQVLETAEELALPLYYIELQPMQQEGQAIQSTGRRITVPGAKVISKPHSNAFAKHVQPNLDRELKQQQITMLVMMGYASPFYVEQSAIGGYDDDHLRGHPMGSGLRIRRLGATQLGYTVLTSDAVVWGGVGRWQKASSVQCYEAA